jgi:hypothetical protein
VEIGELKRARRLCEKLLSYASVLGLYGEEIDTHTGRHLGNFPQAFTHLALINAAMHVIEAETRETAPAVVPLAPAEAEELAVAERTDGPVDGAGDGRRNGRRPSRKRKATTGG